MPWSTGVLYFNIQRTEKYSIAMCYVWSGAIFILLDDLVLTDGLLSWCLSLSGKLQTTIAGSAPSTLCAADRWVTKIQKDKWTSFQDWETKRQIDIGSKQMHCYSSIVPLLTWSVSSGSWICMSWWASFSGGTFTVWIHNDNWSVNSYSMIILCVYYFWSVDSSSMIFLSILSQVSSRPGW